MAQYIDVVFDDEKKYYSNSGLYEIIEYIGRQEYKNKSPLSPDEAYKLGKKFINSRLKKWHMTAIERLVKAEKYKSRYNYDQRTIKPVWKIHRRKAKKIFSRIYEILRRYNNMEVYLYFTALCVKYGFLSGADAAGYPYYPKLLDINQLVANNFERKEIEDLGKCATEIRKFSDFYHSN